MIYFPICKINLGLRVVSKRNDGYHEVSTLMYPVTRLCDTLEVVRSDEFSFSQSGLEIDCPLEKNICYKAWELMRQEFSLSPVAIHLHKVIPFGAGLGGGSSDAAYVIRAINEVFNLGLSRERMIELASVLGSDTAFFIDNAPAWATGRGEVLSPSSVSLSGKRLVILKPDDMVSTGEAYSGVFISGERGQDMENLPLEQWKDNVLNDFEEHIFKSHPRIAELKSYLYNKGAIYASMSGSGASVYGIFDNEAEISIDLDDIFSHQEVIF